MAFALENLQSLFLGKLDKNLEAIVGLSQLRKLELRAVKNKDLSFLKQMLIKDLSILWCDSSKIDLTVLSDFRTLRQLKLLEYPNWMIFHSSVHSQDLKNSN